jgi:hypothetical protein
MPESGNSITSMVKRQWKKAGAEVLEASAVSVALVGSISVAGVGLEGLREAQIYGTKLR